MRYWPQAVFRSALLTITLLLPVITTLAINATAQENGLPPAEAIRGYAAKFGKPGTPEYTAALREGILQASRLLKDPASGKYSKTRSITLEPDSEVRSIDGEAPVPSLEIDKDERYQAWLETAADEPFLDLGLDDEDEAEVRSVGGETIKDPRAFPEVGVSVDDPTLQNKNGFCSGTLIDRSTVLTAAHCLCGGKITHVIFGTSPKASNSYPVEVAAVKGYPGPLCKGNSVSNSEHWNSLRGTDIALLRLKQKVPEPAVPRLGILAAPALIHDQFKKNKTSLVVVGFGRTEAGDQDRKNYSIVPILSPDCKTGASAMGSDDALYGCLPGKEILAIDYRDHKAVGPCPGDSGGAAYLHYVTQSGGTVQKHIELVGIISRTVRESQQCGDGAIYTLLTPEMLDWIKTTSATLPAAK